MKNRIQYETSKIIKKSKSKTSFDRGWKFRLEIEKLLL